jgi:DNA polymerase-1
MSAKGLAARVGISIQDAEAGINARKRHYNKYYAWQDRQIREAKRLSYVRTVTGRPIWVNKYNFKFRRNAINGPVQGSAADQTKLALAYVHEQCRSKGVPFTVNLVVHDEIVMDIPRGMMKTYRKILKDAWLEAGKKLMPTVPTEVDMSSGKTWRTNE